MSHSELQPGNDPTDIEGCLERLLEKAHELGVTDLSEKNGDILADIDADIRGEIRETLAGMTRDELDVMCNMIVTELEKASGEFTIGLLGRLVGIPEFDENTNELIDIAEMSDEDIQPLAHKKTAIELVYDETRNALRSYKGP